MVPWNSALGRFAYNWQSKWVGIISIKTERTQIHFLSDVLVAVPWVPDARFPVSVNRRSCLRRGVSAAGEDSFSTVRCLKTWLRSRMADERFSNLEVWNGHRSLFPVMRTVRETSVLRTTSKSSNLRKVYLTYWLYWRRLYYICWGCKEDGAQMPDKCQNTELNVSCIGKIF